MLTRRPFPSLLLALIAAGLLAVFAPAACDSTSSGGPRDKHYGEDGGPPYMGPDAAGGDTQTGDAGGSDTADEVAAEGGAEAVPDEGGAAAAEGDGVADGGVDG